MSDARTGNLISVALTADQGKDIGAKTAALREALGPVSVQLSPDLRRSLSRMGPKTIDFVTKALDYAKAHPELMPKDFAIDEFERDVNAATQIRGFQQELMQINDLLDDGYLAARSDAYSAGRVVYDVVKSAAKRGVPGAETMANDLGQRFAGTRSSGPDKPDA